MKDLTETLLKADLDIARSAELQANIRFENGEIEYEVYRAACVTTDKAQVEYDKFIGAKEL